ncbi:hypothetical protein RRG08_032496 [Elysia crispata]|uniref:Uncharacterized protein n=1 Tax=Elysia crispata TaxID=231223 RepID=A0AAE1DP05_9GAST|nr:hypothetical protein RRG08_032496 [Elysia crispata]
MTHKLRGKVSALSGVGEMTHSLTLVGRLKAEAGRDSPVASGDVPTQRSAPNIDLWQAVISLCQSQNTPWCPLTLAISSKLRYHYVSPRVHRDFPGSGGRHVLLAEQKHY